jgi:hypothetical protein
MALMRRAISDRPSEVGPRGAGLGRSITFDTVRHRLTGLDIVRQVSKPWNDRALFDN